MNKLKLRKCAWVCAVILAFGALAGLLNACRYPEASPSLHSPEYRIVGSWKLEHTYLNGESIDSTDVLANKPGAIYYFYADHVFNVLLYHNGEMRQSTFSTWTLHNRDCELAMDFTILGRRYTYDAVVKKLTRRELNYEYDDAEGNHWRLELQSSSLY